MISRVIRRKTAEDLHLFQEFFLESEHLPRRLVFKVFAETDTSSYKYILIPTLEEILSSLRETFYKRIMLSLGLVRFSGAIFSSKNHIRLQDAILDSSWDNVCQGVNDSSFKKLSSMLRFLTHLIVFLHRVKLKRIVNYWRLFS